MALTAINTRTMERDGITTTGISPAQMLGIVGDLENRPDLASSTYYHHSDDIPVSPLHIELMDWRHDQAAVLEQVMFSMNNRNAGSDVIVWEGPPGCGKSLVPALAQLATSQYYSASTSAMVIGANDEPRKLAIKKGNFWGGSVPARYVTVPARYVTVLTATRDLQNQYAESLGAVELYGRSNYPCLNSSVVAAWDPVKPTADHCPFRLWRDCAHWGAVHDDSGVQPCPYYEARNKAMRARFMVTNYAYFWYSMMRRNDKAAKNDMYNRLNGRSLLVLDEAHRIDQVVANLAQLQVSERQRQRFGLPAFPNVAGDSANIHARALTWVKSAINELNEIARITNLAGGQVTPKMAHAVQRLDKTLTYVGRVLEEGEPGEYYIWKDQSSGDFTMKPVDTGKHALEQLLRPALAPDKYDPDFDISSYRGAVVLMMSGTIGDPEQFINRLNLRAYDPDMSYKRLIMNRGVLTVQVTAYTSPHMIPVEDRPVILVRDAPSISRATSGDVYKRQVSMIADAIKSYRKYSGATVLIHTGSWINNREIASGLAQRKIGPLAIHPEQVSRLEAMEWINRQPMGTVIVSPSMREGWDAAGISTADDDRVPGLVIFSKAPYLSLADPITKARLGRKGGRAWYQNECTMQIVQGAGRGLRRQGDRCITLIFDTAAKRALIEAPPPPWFTESIEEITSDRLDGMFCTFFSHTSTGSSLRSPTGDNSNVEEN